MTILEDELKSLEIAYVDEMPKCDYQFCQNHAAYDFRTTFGSWMYGCEVHWIQLRMYEFLGTGRGQKLKLEAERPRRGWQEL